MEDCTAWSLMETFQRDLLPFYIITFVHFQGKKSESCVICCVESNCNEGINTKEAFKKTKPESQNSASSVVANVVSVFIVAISAKLF